MSEQPKSRTIKTIPQGTPPSVLQVQFDAIINHLINIEQQQVNMTQQLDFLIAQPQTKPKLADPVPEQKPEQKMEKSLGVWEQTPKEKKEQDKATSKAVGKIIDKKKSGKGTIIFLFILGIIILTGIYFAWAYTQGYTFFWNA